MEISIFLKLWLVVIQLYVYPNSMNYPLKTATYAVYKLYLCKSNFKIKKTLSSETKAMEVPLRDLFSRRHSLVQFVGCPLYTKHAATCYYRVNKIDKKINNTTVQTEIVVNEERQGHSGCYYRSGGVGGSLNKSHVQLRPEKYCKYQARRRGTERF